MGQLTLTTKISRLLNKGEYVGSDLQPRSRRARSLPGVATGVELKLMDLTSVSLAIAGNVV